MWQRFTENARKAVFYAQEEAQTLGAHDVCTEHFLLGLLRTDSTAAKILEATGVKVSDIRAEVLKLLPNEKPQIRQDMTLSPRAKLILDHAYEEARLLGDNFIGTEHLLLAMYAEEEGLAGKVLRTLTVELQTARELVRNERSKPAKE